MNVRPVFRTTAIVVFIVLIPIVIHQVWDYIELQRLVAEIDAIRARKEPVSEADGRPGRAPEPGEAQRAGRLYTAAAVLAANHASAVNKTIDGVHEWLAGAAPVPPGDAASRVAAVVAESADALRLADQASGLPFGGFAPGTDYSYRGSELRDLARLIGVRTLHLAFEGQADGAVESELAMMTMQRAIPERRWTALFGRGHETAAILSLSSPSPEALERLQRLLEQDEHPDDGVDFMLSQRARSIEMMWRRYYGSNPQAPQRYLLPMRSVTETLARPWITRQFVRSLRIWADLIETAREPWPGRVAAAAAKRLAHDAERERWGTSMEMPRQTSPGFWAMALSMAAYDAFSFATRPDDLVLNRASRTAVAVERFRRAHQGALPGSLADLVPDYLPAVPQDPVSAGPLLFRKDAASFTIYSVGANKKDDGGDLNSELLGVIRQGYGRRTIRGADLGVRVVLR